MTDAFFDFRADPNDEEYREDVNDVVSYVQETVSEQLQLLPTSSLSPSHLTLSFPSILLSPLPVSHFYLLGGH